VSLASHIPWQVKIATKILLSRLPLPYSFWSRVNLFKHGGMQDVGYASQVFATHFKRSGLEGKNANGFVCLELGPGDSLLTAILARARGAVKTYIVDTGPFAVRDVGFYRDSAACILDGTNIGISPALWKSVEDMLEDCNATYLTAGLASLRLVPDGTVDWSWSQAVLEHVRRAHFIPTLRELRRVANVGGRSTHRIDLQDHLGGRLNSLRFSHARWEGKLFSESGFYTNRLRCSEIIAAVKTAGFRVVCAEPDLWESVPTPRLQMNAAFRDLSDTDLRTRWVDLTLAAD